ncbi:MAG: ABC transporter substrate-binding protein, partial [Dehalococcoidia bacterium]|nr:ABC transporter substrate-binding protein [Dehalococcoidia bacterium]
MKTSSGLHWSTLIALMIGAVFLVPLIEGCSTTQPSSGDTSGTTTTATKPYGSLTIQTEFVSGNIDPHQISMATFWPLGAAIFDSLIELTPEGQLRPGIAERWEIAPDGKTHTFYIRKGVKFHDGSDLTGADVKYSLERVLTPTGTHSDGIIWRAAVASVELKDDYTVVMNMKVPQFELLAGFTSLGGSPAVAPKKYIEEKGVDYFGKQPVGSGPWKVLSYQHGTRMELEAVESHWRAVPKFKNITLLNVPEESTRVAMLKTGELDMAAVSPDSVPGLKA